MKAVLNRDFVSHLYNNVLIGLMGLNFCHYTFCKSDHGRIQLDPDYPRKAPIISLLTPSGRWDVNKPICLSG